MYLITTVNKSRDKRVALRSGRLSVGNLCLSVVYEGPRAVEMALDPRLLSLESA